jgi:basic amino acid/polyamine antiporter, APA family
MLHQVLHDKCRATPAGIGRMSATIAMALLGLTTVILVLLYGQSRIFATMANDGLLPPVFARSHPRLGTPWISQLIIGVGSRSGW